MTGKILQQKEQKYVKGTPFTTYTLADGLSTWNWTGRTLSGLRDENGDIHQPGEQMTLDGNTTRLSAVWTLNRIPLSVYLIGEGSDSVSVKITQTSNPVWNNGTGSTRWNHSQKPEKYYSFDDTISQTSSVNVPYEGCISIDITPSEDTNIESVFYGGEDKGRDTRHIEQSAYGGYYTTEKSLSVTYTKKGILYYVPNQDYVNP